MSGLRPVIFLAAGVPDRSDRPPENKALFDDRQPDRVQRAVTHLARATLETGACLLFGGHPAVSPLVLEVLRRFVGTADRSDPRVVIYQSEEYRRYIPQAAITLSEDPTLPSRLIWTPKQATEPESLLEMRTRMLETPGIVGAVFVGGLHGVVEEADLFRAQHPTLPMFPVRSTGSAAAVIARRTTGHLALQGFNRDLLDLEVYPVVAQAILQHLHLAAGATSPA